MPAVHPRRICVVSTPARLGLGTCRCERYISSSGLRPVGTPDDATMQSATASHGIHVTNRTRMSRSTPPITNGVVFSTPARLGLGTCHCERYISPSGLRPVGTSDDVVIQSATAPHGIHVTNRTRISRSTLPSRTVLCFRHQLASWDWALVIVKGTFHHLVCDQLVHLMMPPSCNQPLHHTEFTSRTERGYSNRPFPSRTASSLRALGRVSLAHPRTLILLKQWPPPDTTPDAAGLLSPPPSFHHERCCVAKRSDLGHRGGSR